jgi:hypothetical protein
MDRKKDSAQAALVTRLREQVLGKETLERRAVRNLSKNEAFCDCDAVVFV